MGSLPLPITDVAIITVKRPLGGYNQNNDYLDKSSLSLVPQMAPLRLKVNTMFYAIGWHTIVSQGMLNISSTTVKQWRLGKGSSGSTLATSSNACIASHVRCSFLFLSLLKPWSLLPLIFLSKDADWYYNVIWSYSHRSFTEQICYLWILHFLAPNLTTPPSKLNK